MICRLEPSRYVFDVHGSNLLMSGRHNPARCVHAHQHCQNKVYILLANSLCSAVKNIASNHTHPPEDTANFFDCLRTLVKHCNFDVNSTVDEENKIRQPLLLRSALANYVHAISLPLKVQTHYQMDRNAPITN